MKRGLMYLLVLGCVYACTQESLEPGNSPLPVTPSLSNTAIRLESSFIFNQADYTVRLDKAQTITIKIVDIAGKVVSSEKVSAKEGDNILTLYTKALPKSSYQLKLYNESNEEISKTIINVL